jgi:hypothetical protein
MKLFRICRYSPSVVSELVGAAEDAKSGEVIEDINFSLPDNFIRPFREEIDSRNEYRTQVSYIIQKVFIA